MRSTSWWSVALVFVLAACETEAGPADAAMPLDAPLEDAGTSDAATPELDANAGASRYAEVGEEVLLDGSASAGALEYQWSAGDGRAPGPRSSDPTLRVVYAAPGRYSAVLTVFDAGGRRRSDVAIISVVRPSVHAPRSSSSIALAGPERFVVVSPDSDELALMRWDEAGVPSVVSRIAVCDDPRSVSVHTPEGGASRALVACRGGGVAIADLESGTAAIVPTPYGARPFGALVRGDGRAFVSFGGHGELAEVRIDDPPAIVRRLPAVQDAHALALHPDGRIAVTRWRSPDRHGALVLVDPDSGARETIELALDPQIASDTEIGGVPTFLEEVRFSPDGTLAILPSLQAAIDEGLFVTSGDRALTFQTTVRAVLSFVDVAGGAELFERRRQLDNRGFANAGVFTSRGDFFFAVTRGNRTVERYDVLRSELSGSIDGVGYAPRGVVLSPDDRFLFVDAYLSREVVAYDVRSFVDDPAPIARARIVATEPLPPPILRGHQLFADSADPRLARDGYIACAHCHLDGESDLLTWDFTDRGEGMRNTISRLGTAAAHGPIHWSGNFDEVQDFEHDIRGPFQGTGLMRDAEFEAGSRGTTLGDAKAGVSEDLDALAAYVASLDTYPPSPFRAEDGTLTAAAERGRIIFESGLAGCTTCHAGDAMTDSAFVSPGVPRLHDVGTLGPGSGMRLGGALAGIDTPTLRGVWSSAPYLHDGSAPTLRDVLTTRNPGDAHGRTSHLSTAELDDLVAYLLSL